MCDANMRELPAISVLLDHARVTHQGKSTIKARAPNMRGYVDIVHSLVADCTLLCSLPAMFKEGICAASGLIHLVMTVWRKQAEVLCRMQNWCSL